MSFVVTLLIAGLTLFGAPMLAHASVDDSPVTSDVPVATESPIATNEFLPEERNLTECIGMLQRPGCGSESRGGWRQTAVFGVIGFGLIVVFGNVIRGVRRNRAT